MKISLNSVCKVLHEFIQTSLVPKVNSPFQFILSLGNCYLEDLVLGNKLTEFYSNYFRVLEALGILENNQIDIDKLKLNSLKALQSCNGKVEIPLYSNKLYSLDRDDIEMIYEIASKYKIQETQDLEVHEKEI